MLLPMPDSPKKFDWEKVLIIIAGLAALAFVAIAAYLS
jgi:hypothetical protein